MLCNKAFYRDIFTSPFVYISTYSRQCVRIFVQDSELLFALVFGESWPGEILGQVKLLPAPQLRQKAHWILSHHSLLKQTGGVFLVCVNLGWNIVFLLFSILNIPWQMGNINSRGSWTFHSSSWHSHYIQKENLCCANVELQQQTSCNASSQINAARLLEVRWKQTLKVSSRSVLCVLTSFIFNKTLYLGCV